MTEEVALNRAASYCSSAEQCKEDIKIKLKRWGMDDSAIIRIIKELVSEKYIDEERYCRAYVNDKLHFQKWGRAKIKQGLYQKKLSSDMIEKYVNEIDEDEYLSILQGLIQVKRKNTIAKDDFTLNGKLVRFALNRGFEMKYIIRFVNISGDNSF